MLVRGQLLHLLSTTTTKIHERIRNSITKTVHRGGNLWESTWLTVELSRIAFFFLKKVLWFYSNLSDFWQQNRAYKLFTTTNHRNSNIVNEFKTLKVLLNQHWDSSVICIKQTKTACCVRSPTCIDLSQNSIWILFGPGNFHPILLAVKMFAL